MLATKKISKARALRLKRRRLSLRRAREKILIEIWQKRKNRVIL